MMEEKFEHWIPWYVNGTLGANERAEMDRYLASNADAQRDVALFQQAASALIAQSNGVSVDIGLNKAIAKNRALSANKMGKSNVELKSENVDTFFSVVRRWFGTSWLQPAFALALTVIGVQMFMLTRGSNEMQMRGASTISATGAARSVDSAYLRVAFNPTATEGELRVLLSANQGNVVAGPGLEGEYVVAVPTANAMRALDVLRASRAVASANPTEAPK
jgi:hypothetical protein